MREISLSFFGSLCNRCLRVLFFSVLTTSKLIFKLTFLELKTYFQNKWKSQLLSTLLIIIWVLFFLSLGWLKHCVIFILYSLAGMCWCSYLHKIKISLLPSLPWAWMCSKQRQASDEIWAYVLALIYVFSTQKTAEKISQQDCFPFKTVLLLMSLCPNNGNISFLCVCNYIA